MSDQQRMEGPDATAGVESSSLTAALFHNQEDTARTEVIAQRAGAPASDLMAGSSGQSGHAAAHFAPAPVTVPAPTATSTYAHACELVAVALRDLAEYNQAVGSLTQVLPTVGAAAGARSGRDGMTQQILRAAPAAPAVEEREEPNRPGKSRRGLKVALAAAAVALLAVAAAWMFLASGGMAMLSKPELADVERVLGADEAFMAGFTASEYVESEPYELSDVSITQIAENDGGPIRVDATAKLKNGFFESDCIAVLMFVHASEVDRYPDFEHVAQDAGEGGWIGYVAQASASKTRAVAGVTHDPEFPEGFSASFDPESQTCKYDRQTQCELWFGTRATVVPYTYAFDGRAWTRSTGEPAESFSFAPGALDGLYGSNEGDAVRMGSFKIANFDASSGAFTLEYRASTSGLAPQTISGVIDCVVEVAPATDANASFRQADGYVYSFAGDGTSTGGEGTSHIEGCLGLDGSIVFDFSGDYTKPAFLFGDPSNETMGVSGIVARVQG